MVNILRPKLNVIELTMIGALVALLGYFGGAYHTAWRMRPFVSRNAGEVEGLAVRYGPARNSENSEEWIVRDFFRDKRGGIFIDVGANHYRRASNTYYLETQLGWSGIAIEPQVKYAADYALHRPRTIFVPLFVSDVSNRQAVLYVPRNDLMASADKAFAASAADDEIEPVAANTTTLDDVLDRHAIREVDFLSIDIELHEPQALKGFSIERFRPQLAVVEAHAPVRQQILNYFTKHGYVIAGKYLRADTDNLWFAPLDALGPSAIGAAAGK
jgi:FkbM family methyltransferase